MGMSQVVIGMDPHKRSATIEVMASDERVLGGGRYATDATGYGAMLAEARRWPQRMKAIEGCQGMRAHVLHGREGNLAAVYVCTVPGKRSRLRRVRDAGDREFADLLSSRSEVGKAPRAREAQPNTTTARAPRGLSLLPPIRKPNLHTWPKNRTEALGMAQAM
jgi:hypothetical protein